MVGVSDSYVTCYTPEAKNVKLDIYSIHTALSRGSCRVSQDLGLLTVSFFFLFFFYKCIIITKNIGVFFCCCS